VEAGLELCHASSRHGRTSRLGKIDPQADRGFDGRHAIFNEPGAARTVVVVSFSQLQNCLEDSKISRGGCSIELYSMRPRLYTAAT
jgi:hypothetical protein